MISFILYFVYRKPLLTLQQFQLYSVMLTIKPPSLEDFMTAINNFSMQEKYFKWENYLQSLKQTESPFYQVILEKFVQYFPFNYTYWGEAVDQSLKVPKTGKGNAVRLYQLALAKNPRSITLWKNYLDWLRKQICKSDPSYLKKQHDKAMKIIGNHYKAGFIFQNAFQLQESAALKYVILKKAMISPLQEIDLIYDIAASWLENTTVYAQTLAEIANQEGMSVAGLSQTDLRQKLKAQLRRLYEPTKKHVQMRHQWQSKLNEADEYHPYTGNIQVWRGYISWLKSSGNPELITPLYERALITNCDNQSLWQQYFYALENQSNLGRALYLLRSHAIFFRSFSKQLTYYWVQLQQKDNHLRSREIYLQLQQSEPNLEVFLRHIQMQIRYKEFLNARILYQTVLTIFTSNLNILSFILIQYAELSLKYFRDVDVRKLLRSYFDSYPFHQGLFFSVLQFFKSHIQYKDNNREGKQASYEQFLTIILDGLSRALKTTPERYAYICKVARKHLRDYVPNIFLLKAAEKKIKDNQLKIRREGDQLSQLKRDESGLMQPQS